MTNQEKFERDAEIILGQHQATLDLKLFLCHWGGYEETKTRFKTEIQDLAQKYGVDLDLKKWKLNGHWM